MANEYAVNAADLTAVADAIRAKSGVSDALVFPSGFADAVAGISTDGDMDVGEIILEESSMLLTVPTSKRRKNVAIFADDPVGLGLTAYQIFAGVAHAGDVVGTGYGGLLYRNYNNSGNAGGSAPDQEDQANTSVGEGPAFFDDGVKMPRKLSGTNTNVWVAGVTYKYYAWG